MPTPEHDLLIDPFKTIYAVNCRVEGATLHCGALLVEPQNPFKIIRLADTSATLDVTLPDELVDQPTLRKGWDVTLPILNPDEQVQRPL